MLQRQAAVDLLVRWHTMLARLFSRWRNARQWRREHVESFARVATPNEEGVTPFQAQCLAAVDSIVSRGAFQVAVHSDGTRYFVAPIPGTTAELFVHDTEAGIHGPSLDWRFEEWDYRTPEELVAKVVESLHELHAT